MKLTFGWLRDHLDTAAEIGVIADKLTALGLEVEQVVDRGQALKAFTVARVISAERHPNADKLSVCIVDTGRERVQVVCGAPNARAGMLGVFAPPGSTLPGTGLLLKPTAIRGVDSRGMLCSEREMGLSDEHAGIIELAAGATLGSRFASVVGLDDPLIEIKLTANRGDCLGVRGIARELAAAGIGRLKPLDTTPVKGSFASRMDVKLDFNATTAAACPLFIGRSLRGVKNGASPAWLSRRLTAIGLRPISALVDVTNYITFDLGRPLHVFDADRVKGDLRVRLAKAGEKLAALDGREYALDGEMCVIADDGSVLSLGGVMGGETTGCTAETKNVFIEAALFDPVRTAATGRKLGIHSDARYRFERGVDPAFVRPGLEIATRLFQKLCGGEASAATVAGREPGWRKTVALRPERAATLGGVDLPEAESTRLLQALGFTVARQNGHLAVEPPSWRPDIDGEADLVEEVIRLHGYDAIPTVSLPLTAAVARPAIDANQRRARTARRALAAQGLAEAVTYSFVGRAHAALFGGGGEALQLANPISADLDCLRPSVLPGLMAAAKRNQDRGESSQAMFELGPVYADDSPAGQGLMAGALRAGTTGQRHWSQPPRAVDAFDAKGDALAALAACGFGVESLQVVPSGPAWYHPGRSGSLMLGPKIVMGVFGELHPKVAAAFDLKGPAVACEVFLDRLPPAKAKSGTARAALKRGAFQAVERDFAFVVADEVPADALVKAARSADKAAITGVTAFDVFAGPALGAGKKSVAIAVRLEPSEKTFTDAEIEAIAQKIVAAVAKATGGALRG
jgi:phenylalanyl-tRNA synthetase beta chain